MFPFKAISYIFFRGYSRKCSRNLKSQRVVPEVDDPEMQTDYPGITEDNFDPFEEYHDYDSAESDFTKVGKLYDEHIRETKRAKELLKSRIVAKKQFKSTDPNFLTWSEKEEIRSLYNKNNVEWTPGRLSESFPALPATIKKILKAKWSPTSAESIIKYDQQIINNWKKFREGSIAINPQLKEHLKKFKDRKIELENVATIAQKFVKQPMKFPLPKSNTFSNIVKDYIQNDAQKNEIQPRIAAESGNNASRKSDNTIIKSNNSTGNLLKVDKYNKNKMVNFDTFLETKVAQIADKSNLSLPNQLLVDEYKNTKSMEALNNNKLVDVKHDEKESSSALGIVESPSAMVKAPEFDRNRDKIDTGILEWKKKTLSSEEDYPAFIKIPRAKSKPGVTFKVVDRYYDSDGEFLYRVPFKV